MSFESAMQFWSDWGLRISVLVSLAAHVFLGLLSGIRRRSASDRLSRIVELVLRILLWLLYQFAEIGATYALGNLSLSVPPFEVPPGVVEEEQMLAAFWAPFLLLHLGGPDNMIAYGLEDDMPSLRKLVEMGLRFFALITIIWNYIYRRHSLILFRATVIISFQAFIKYNERTFFAMRKANLEYMQEPPGSSSRASSCSSTESRSLQLQQQRALDLDDGEALLIAQDLFHVCGRFLEDYSVVEVEESAREKVLSLHWRSMCKVVEMELSLMYEVLYTKALMTHTLQGYLIPFTSPFFTAAAALLFWLHRANKQDSHQVTGSAASAATSFVVITYLLLGTVFTLDVVWLLRALGSTWTYAFLKTKLARPWWPWAFNQAVCVGWWRRLHRFVVYLDPLRLALGIDPVAYRRWSGAIGRYNLLHECSVPPPRRRPWLLLLRWLETKLGRPWMPLLLLWLETMLVRPWVLQWLVTEVGLKDTKHLSEIPEGVKALLFERVQLILPKPKTPARRPDGGGLRHAHAYTMASIRTCWGHEALRRSEKLFEHDQVELAPKFGREFEEDVIVWHIATCIFLSRTRVRKVASSSSSTHATAIDVMSEYLMFLVAKRPHMVPGINLHSLLEETRRALEVIWRDDRKGNETLATLLRRKRNSKSNKGEGKTAWAVNDGQRLVSDASAIAGALTKGSRNQQRVVQMLEFIFNVWVDKLLYAAIRCSRESHAKQLSLGGELTTVLWMLVQHAGPFRIGQEMPVDEKERQKNKSREKKAAAPAPAPTPAPSPPPPTYPWSALYPWPDSWPWPQLGYDHHMPSTEDEQAGISMIPMVSTEGGEHEELQSDDDDDEIPIPEDEEDPDDERDYNTAVEYITLY